MRVYNYPDILIPVEVLIDAASDAAIGRYSTGRIFARV